MLLEGGLHRSSCCRGTAWQRDGGQQGCGGLYVGLVWGLSGVQHRRARCWTWWVTVPRVYPRLPGQGFVSEDEYLEITGITREQSGEYECSASNDVAAPVVQRVKVTVNCE